MESIELTTAQRFEIEKMSRVIDGTSDVQVLRDLSKQLLVAWMTQKAASIWAIRQSDPRGRSFSD